LIKRLEEITKRLEELGRTPATPDTSEEFVALFQEKRGLEQTIRASKQIRRPANAAGGRDRLNVEGQSGSILANVNSELSKLERRDWELWWIVSVTGILVCSGLMAILIPAAFTKAENFHFEITVPRQLVVGLMVLLVLLNTYLVSRRMELRRLRERAISSTIQNELVRLQSFTDPLTEVYNRRSLEDLANRYISHARRLRKPLTFLLIDVDSFKQVNTRFGHLTGDFVLTEIAGLLRTAIRGSDALIRYGGDEFLTILADASATEAHHVINRMHAYMNDWNQGGHLEDCAISFSIGIAEWVEGKTLDEALELADQNMYARKAQLDSLPPAKARAATATS
jgi:diguanylate cyclase (GGDEF)-like protein